jgi:hypothetical protein
MSNRIAIGLVFTAVFAVSGTTKAQESTVAGGPSAVPWEPSGFALQVGAGVTGLMNREAREHFDRGGFWEVRAILGTDSYLGAEIGYVASSRSAKGRATGRSPALMGDGVESLLRFNGPISLGGFRLEPYALAGVSWTHYTVARRPTDPLVAADEAETFSLPMGAGWSVANGHYLVDARFVYRRMLAGRLIASDGQRIDLGNWSMGGTVGYQF